MNTKMRSITKLIVLSAIPLMFLSSCYKDNFNELHPDITSTVCDTNKVISFSADIMPIMNNSCGTNNSCHGVSNTSRIDLSNYSGVDAVALDGRLVGSVTWAARTSSMPKGSLNKISICDQTKIKKWVTNGSLNN